MRKLAVALVLVAVSGVAFADDKADAVATVKSFVEKMNRGDMAGAAATCASPASVVDDFPPFAWQGPTACADWARERDAGLKSEGMTPGDVTLSKPSHVMVNGDRAYVVAPAKFEFRQKGKKVNEKGATFTVALQKQAAGWRITGWSWSAGK
jgi:ketosteroid isomerase-like protein